MTHAAPFTHYDLVREESEDPPRLIENVTAVSVIWREGHRIAGLLEVLVKHFTNIVVVVQESDDNTLDECRRILTGPHHKVIEDEWRKGGDFSMPLALSHVDTEWTFVISGDEMPDYELLTTMPKCVEVMEQGGNSGAFLNCKEWIDGIPYFEYPSHVRLFRTSGGWEARHHSAAPHENTIQWPFGNYLHVRTLDEVCKDYLRKLHMMEEEFEAAIKRDDRADAQRLANLANVNRTMLYRACKQTAEVKGWRYVWNHEWWPEVDRIVFSKLDSGVTIL